MSSASAVETVTAHQANDLTVPDVGGRKNRQLVALDMDRQELMPAPEAHDACLIEGHFTRYLPQRIKRWIRFTLFPDKERLQGVSARYDRCTRRDMQPLPARHGRQVERWMRYCPRSSFSFFVPLRTLWWDNQLGFKDPARAHAAEILSLVLHKP